MQVSLTEMKNRGGMYKANTRSNTYALHPHHEHGYGIQNIKRVIRKYNGTYLVKKEDVYKLMISFPLDVGNVKI